MTQDPVMIGFASVVVSGVVGLLTGVLGRRVSSASEMITAIDLRIKTYMQANDKLLKDLKDQHAECEKKVSSLRKMVHILLDVLRKRGIPIPHLPGEEFLLLESRSFDPSDSDDLTDPIPPAE